MERKIVALYELLDVPIDEWTSKLIRSSNYQVHQSYESHRIDLESLMEHPVLIGSWKNCEVCRIARLFYRNERSLHLKLDRIYPNSNTSVAKRISNVVSSNQQGSRAYKMSNPKAHPYARKKTSETRTLIDEAISCLIFFVAISILGYILLS